MTKSGFSDVIVGLDYGDEGKGRVTDQKLSSGNYQVATRFNGGNNAGHTIQLADGTTIVLNAIPSGILHPDIINYIGSGCVVDPVHLITLEIPKVEKIIKLKGRLKISTLASAITPLHILLDKRNGKLIGTTGRGIGPAYTDRVRRAEGNMITNIRLGDIIANPEKIRTTLLQQCHDLACKIDLDYTALSEAVDLFINSALQLNEQSYLEKDALWLTRQCQSGQNVLMEGAQAHGLDITHGVPPFTTSSNTIASNAYVGGDLSAKYHRQTTGVTKLIRSRVGSGPFVGELGNERSETYCADKNAKGESVWTRDKETKFYNGDLEALKNSPDPFLFGIYLRIKTGEYGATTGRPRRIGAIDLVHLRNACAINGVDELFVTKADCLNEYADNLAFQGKIPVINKYTVNNAALDYLPSTSEELYKVVPEACLTKAPREKLVGDSFELSSLPVETAAILAYIQDFTATRISGIGVGSGRDEVIQL